MIGVESLRKSFGDTLALDGVDLDVAEGTVLGLLGPNGAGKTTAVRILATLLRPDAGLAHVAGYDCVRDAHRVRSVIGLTGQYAAIDENLSGFENLEMIGRLLGLGRQRSRERADELLERFELKESAHRYSKTYSGGMRRRLDVAGSLVGRPRVLFLDEPTTGLDPRSRLELWRLVRELVAEGTTVLLTTQYLEEADQLSDDIAVIDRGKVIARGTPDELKSRTAGKVLEVRPADIAQLRQAASALEFRGSEARIDSDSGSVNVDIGDDMSQIAAALRRLDRAKVPLSDVAVHSPSLNDVFVRLTGGGGPES
ncbi:MAG TPA: ATP-binding cassette domain-containing protein [Actinomycetota bacterium]|nr:ATP-binding cassette domain-containing protein [Actinomycetota bacterium]